MSEHVMILKSDPGKCTHFANFLKSKGYKVSNFCDIRSADDYLNINMNEIDYILTGLNIDGDFLGEQRNKSDGDELSGWVWLQYFAYQIKPNIPTVIFSKHLINLKYYLEINGELVLLEKGNIKLVEDAAKHNNESYENVLRELKGFMLK